mgnify:FL=1
MLFSFSLVLFLMPNANAVINHINITQIGGITAVNHTYNRSLTDAGYIIVNVSVGWSAPTNITNITLYVINGENISKFYNHTTNGSRSTTLGGDFRINISLSEGTYTLIAEAANVSEIDGSDYKFLNSSPIIFTFDKTFPVASLERPHNKEGVTPSDGIITLEYTFTEANAGNSTLYVDGARIKSSTSGSINPNVSTGLTNKFTRRYAADDSSESWLIEITDLAGNKANSSASIYSVIYSGGEIQTRAFTPSGQPIPNQADVQKAQAQGRPLSVSPPKTTGSGFIGFLMGWWWVILIFIVVGMYIYNKIQQS